jgi:hypothetical protein
MFCALPGGLRLSNIPLIRDTQQDKKRQLLSFKRFMGNMKMSIYDLM